MCNKWSTKLKECILVQNGKTNSENDWVSWYYQKDLTYIWAELSLKDKYLRHKERACKKAWRCHIVGWIKETKFYMTEVRVHVGLDQRRVWKKHRIFPLSSGALIFSFFRLIWCRYFKIWMWTWIILDLGNENSQSFSHFDIASKMFFFF